MAAMLVSIRACRPLAWPALALTAALARLQRPR
jgi:hypothetical protein